jgi:hypothetical protein
MGITMGYMTALAISETELSLEQQLAWHLQGNFYPPVPTSMVQPCVDAINAYWNEDTETLIEMPEGVSYKGSNYAPAYAILEQHRLDAWCMEPDWDVE